MPIPSTKIKQSETEGPAGLAYTIVKPTRTLPDLAQDVHDGLMSEPRSLPSKYFYDKYGSQLFERICTTPEYYLTRAEHTLIKQHATTIIEQTRPDQILEFGSGNAQKTRNLFDACKRLGHDCCYAPFECCAEVLIKTTEQLRKEYDRLQLQPLLGDYYAGLDHLPRFHGRRLFVFLGSTIGNFTLQEAACFLREVYACMNAGDMLLVGIDRVKSSKLINAAYNDQQGLTAQFNLNILSVINRRLRADFVLDQFAHSAKFNKRLNRVEMHLIATQDQQVRIKHIGKTIDFLAKDSIRTEVSQKYELHDIKTLLHKCNMKIKAHFAAASDYFSLTLATANR